jgi:hypothetical protein
LPGETLDQLQEADRLVHHEAEPGTDPGLRGVRDLPDGAADRRLRPLPAGGRRPRISAPALRDGVEPPGHAVDPVHGPVDRGSQNLVSGGHQELLARGP